MTKAEALIKAKAQLDGILAQAKETSIASFAESDLSDVEIAKSVDDWYTEAWPGVVAEVMSKVARAFELGDEADCLGSLELH
jgi:hypothetical protein